MDYEAFCKRHDRILYFFKEARIIKEDEIKNLNDDNYKYYRKFEMSKAEISRILNDASKENRLFLSIIKL